MLGEEREDRVAGLCAPRRPLPLSFSLTTLCPPPFFHHRLRAYYLPQRTHGLLFTCTDGVPDFAAPAGVLTGVVVPTRKVKPGQRALPSPVNADESIVGYGYWRVDQVAAEGYNALKRDAHADWYTADHANWTVVTGADGDRTFTTVDALVDYMRAHCVGKEPTIEVPAELKT